MHARVRCQTTFWCGDCVALALLFLAWVGIHFLRMLLPFRIFALIICFGIIVLGIDGTSPSSTGNERCIFNHHGLWEIFANSQQTIENSGYFVEGKKCEKAYAHMARNAAKSCYLLRRNSIVTAFSHSRCHSKCETCKNVYWTRVFPFYPHIFIYTFI